MTARVYEKVEQGELSSIGGGNVNLYNDCINQYGRFSERWESIYLKTQLYCYWAYTQRTLHPTTKDTYLTMVIIAYS